MVLISPTIYADDKESKGKDTQNAKGAMKEFIRVNESVSAELNKAADTIDKNISPASPGVVDKNETFMFVVLGEDFNDHGDMTTNFRFGGQLRLPRFEKYWKLKFDNQDEKRDRGQGTMTRRQRTRNDNDNFFLGVRFNKRWHDVDIDYKPQIAYQDGLGLDHSVDATTKYEYDRFFLEPSFEFFANHGEGTGESGSLKFTLWIYKKYVAIEQGNDARFVNLTSKLAENHYAGFRYIPTDRLNFALHYFRTFQNDIEDFQLAAYGYYLVTNYEIYKNILAIEGKPYLVYERGDNFEPTRGIVVNFRVTF